MKILYYGGQKSGKSRTAEHKALSLAHTKHQTPYYIATYDARYPDAEMHARIQEHQARRAGRFVLIEAPTKPSRVIREGHVHLIDCISMWLLNTLDMDEAGIFEEIDQICSIEADILFVLNDVGSGIIPPEPLSRTYVDRSGVVGQRLAAHCDRVYEVKLGLTRQLK